jgi:hypothetical protein
MSVFQNTNIVFRCPLSLKERLKSVADEREEHLSSFIRSACIEVLRKDTSFYPPNAPTTVEKDNSLKG